MISTLRSLRTTTVRSFASAGKAVATPRPAAFTPAILESAAPPPQDSIFSKLFRRSNYIRVPLTQALPTLTQQELNGFQVSAPSEQVQTTTLPSGLRIATFDTNSPIATVGIFVDAGSRYETPETNGITNFLEQVLMKDTLNRTDFKLVRDIHAMGANIGTSSGRDYFALTGDVMRSNVDQLLATMADLMQFNKFDVDAVAQAQARYQHDVEQKLQSPTMLHQLIHEAAYGQQTVGLPSFAPLHNISKFSSEALRSFATLFFQPHRIMIVGSGVDHEAFTKLSSELFQYLPVADVNVPLEKARYIGGEVRQAAAPSVDGNNDTIFLALGFEGPSLADGKDFFTASVMATVLGGGSSFSAGGPGKGLYSRLYTNVLNRYGFLDSVEAIYQQYIDTGLFFLTAHGPATAADRMIEILNKECFQLDTVTDEELQTAKNRLKRSVALNLENRMIQIQDVAVAMMQTGHHMSQQELLSKIDQVTVSDIQQLSKKMFKSTVSVAAYGNTSHLPRLDSVQKLFS